MTAKAVCRVCLTDVQPKHSTALFSGVGSQHDWLSRLREILGVPVSIDDGLPQSICRSCAGRVETLERKLKSIRQLAYESADKYKAMLVRKTSVTRKRPKNTCGEVGVSPSTASTRPLAKRMYTDLQGRQLFPSVTNKESSSKNKVHSLSCKHNIKLIMTVNCPFSPVSSSG